MVVVDCLHSIDRRAFPYLGNVPVIRMNPCNRDRIERVIGVLLDEVFKDNLWRCRTARLSAVDPGVLFLPRSPELIALATLSAPARMARRTSCIRTLRSAWKKRTCLQPSQGPCGYEPLVNGCDGIEYDGHGEPLAQDDRPLDLRKPHMGTYGLSSGHLREALADFAIHLLASGDDLAYGGDLRAHGFTELLFDLVARYRRLAEVSVRPPVTNYLAWPVHISMTAETLSGFEAHIRGSAQLALIGRDGSRLTMEERHSIQRHEPDESEWTEGLTRMREVMRAETDARVVLGGRVEDYKGRMPGIAEEALLSLQSEQAVFLVGGFGGCTRDIAETLGLVEPRQDPT